MSCAITGPRVPCRACAALSESKDESWAVLMTFCWSSFKNVNSIGLT